MLKGSLALLILFNSLAVCSQTNSDTSVFLIRDIPAAGLLLNSGWHVKPADNSEKSLGSYPGGGWQPVDPSMDVHETEKLLKGRPAWFLVHFRIDSSVWSKSLLLRIRQSGASEIYLDGQFIKRYGELGDGPSGIKAYDPAWDPVELNAGKNAAVHTLAVKYVLQTGIAYTKLFAELNPALSVTVIDARHAFAIFKSLSGQTSIPNLFLAGLFLMMCIIHLSFYWFYPEKKANLFFSMYAFLYLIGSLLIVRFDAYSFLVAHKYYLLNIIMYLFIASHLFIFQAIYALFEKKRDYLFWLIAGFAILAIVFNLLFYDMGWIIGGPINQLVIRIGVIYIAYKAVQEKTVNARIILSGAISSFIFFIAFLFTGPLAWVPYFQYSPAFNQTLYFLSILCIPLATSFSLGIEFAYTSTSLKQKISEVETLSKKTIEQEREKLQILGSQNEMLEKLVAERTSALNHSLEDLKITQAQLVQREKMASLGELTAGIAHEIQNPLNFVNNFSDVNKELIQEMKDELTGGKTENAINIANTISENEQKIGFHGKRADNIVKGMLYHARTSTGQKEPTDINALADEYMQLSYHGLRAKDKSFNVILQTDFDTAIGRINIIPQDIGRVLLNLYNNAFYATMEKKKVVGETYAPVVSVTTKKRGNKIDIAVKDNGQGIPEKIKDKIFQPFFTTKPTGEGTGLGLSLSHDIIKAHGGELKVETMENEFTRFIIELPVTWS